jgi:hypothetical protein
MRAKHSPCLMYFRGNYSGFGKARMSSVISHVWALHACAHCIIASSVYLTRAHSRVYGAARWESNPSNASVQKRSGRVSLVPVPARSWISALAGHSFACPEPETSGKCRAHHCGRSAISFNKRWASRKTHRNASAGIRQAEIENTIPHVESRSVFIHVRRNLFTNWTALLSYVGHIAPRTNNK